MWEWVDGVTKRHTKYNEEKETYYGYNDDYSPPEENNIEYFDMLEAKAEQEIAKEEEEIIKKYLNNDEYDNIDNYESYSNDYWKKR